MNSLRIREIRKSKDWKVQFVADRVGLTRSAYGNIEHGRRKPSCDVVAKLQRLFDKPIDYLLEQEEEAL